MITLEGGADQGVCGDITFQDRKSCSHYSKAEFNTGLIIYLKNKFFIAFTAFAK